MKIDFVSDVVCPWCAVGLASLETALKRVEGTVQPELHFQPFELNPHMAPEGEDIGEHLGRKYGLAPEQLARNREALKERGRAVGFEFGERDRIWNTFDAHRLLYWAGEQGAEQQRALKHRLLQAYHGQAQNVSDRALLARLAGEAGLDEEAAARVLAGDEYAAQVRARERFYTNAGVTGVPAVIIDDQYLISGGQPPEVFEEALRRIAAGETV
jgi:predicted DsbA family dithiol-disulfide isomerase